MTTFRIRFGIAGGHVHCRLFAGVPGQTFANCGEFVVRKGEEFSALVKAFSRADFIGDDPKVGILQASDGDSK
jgi:hypothetical protein